MNLYLSIGFKKRIRQGKTRSLLPFVSVKLSVFYELSNALNIRSPGGKGNCSKGDNIEKLKYTVNKIFVFAG